MKKVRWLFRSKNEKYLIIIEKFCGNFVYWNFIIFYTKSVSTLEGIEEIAHMKIKGKILQMDHPHAWAIPSRIK